MTPLNLNAALIFARVAEHKSFRAASKALGMPKSTVSRQVAALEKRLGVSLLRRTTHQLSLTEPGCRYYEAVAPAIQSLLMAERTAEASRAAPTGLLRISVPKALGERFVGEVVCQYALQWPQMRVEVQSSERPVDLVAEQFDLAIRIGPLESSTLIAKPLGMVRGCFVASPSYLKDRGRPGGPDTLSEHATLSVSRANIPAWPIVKNGSVRSVSIQPRLSFSDFESVRAAAEKGLGVAFLPWFVAAPSLERGMLVSVLERFTPPPVRIHALYPSAKVVPPKVRTFIDLLAEHLLHLTL